MVKRAASKKPIKPIQQPSRPPIEEVWKQAHEMLILTVETQITTAKRVDNLLGIRDFIKNFDPSFEWDMGTCHAMQDVSIGAYEKVLESIKKLELKDFEGEEIEDPFAWILPKASLIKDEYGLMEAGIVFASVRPYGDKIIKLHQLMQDEIGIRKFEEENND